MKTTVQILFLAERENCFYEQNVYRELSPFRRSSSRGKRTSALCGMFPKENNFSLSCICWGGGYFEEDKNLTRYKMALFCWHFVSFNLIEIPFGFQPLILCSFPRCLGIVLKHTHSNSSSNHFVGCANAAETLSGAFETREIFTR